MYAARNEYFEEKTSTVKNVFESGTIGKRIYNMAMVTL